MKDSIRLRKRNFFKLLRISKRSGAQFARLTEIDSFIKKGQAGFFIKHDVHGLFLESLIKFAAKEKSMDIFATYFFMYPEHPHTIKYYSFKEQVSAMRAVKELGHEIGFHIDPFFLIHHYKKPLGVLIKEMINRFNDYDITFNCGNTHGNTSLKLLDKNGYDVVFDLFEELSRQPDYPELRDVSPQIAALIRTNRVSLSDFGFTHWGDLPLWSKSHGYVEANYVTDNFLEKQGTVGILILKESFGYYKLSDKQPPDPSSISSVVRQLIPITNVPQNPGLSEGISTVGFYGSELKSFFKNIACYPTQILIHPQFYVERT